MGRKKTAIAPSNLAFVKYWGKRDEKLRIPTNNSISMNLSNATTKTCVSFDPALEIDQLQVAGNPVSDDSVFFHRVFEQVDRIRDMSGVYEKASVVTENSFPESIGIASSASGFAALPLAASAAAGLTLDQKELSELSRMGSGSACRSIPDGFVEWIALDEHDSSYAIQLAPPEHWDIQILSVVFSQKAKNISSTRGHKLAAASPFFSTRLATLDNRLNIIRSAILEKDFNSFGRETELEALSFHSIAMTSPYQNSHGGWASGIYYWLPESIELVLAVQSWRMEGIEVYFTMDAGPTVHLICQRKDMEVVKGLLLEIESKIDGRKWESIENSPAVGARLVPENNTGVMGNS